MELNIDKTGWEKVKFGEVAIQQKGIVDIETTTLTRYIAGDHMNSNDLHLRKWGTVGEGYLGPAFIRKFEVGDILYGSRRTYLKKVAVAVFEGITSNTTFVIKANTKKIDTILLSHLMLSDGFTEHSVKNSKGSVNPYINWKDIADYEFLLPPKDQQARLAELLWAADEVVEREMEVKERVENALKLYVSKEMGVCNNGNYLVDVFDMVKISSLLSNQKYNVGKLDTTGYNLNGVYPIVDQSMSFIVGYSNIKAEVFDGELPILVFGDHTTIIKYVDFPFILGADGTKIIYPDKNKVIPKFLYYAIKNLNLIPQGYRRHYSILKDLMVPVFEVERQRSIIGRIEEFEKPVEAIKLLIDNSQKIKQGLINEIF